MSSDPGTSNKSGGKDTQTPFGTASSTKTKTKFGYTKPESKVKSYMKTGGVVGAITKPIREKTEDVNRKFYEEKVVPSGKSKAPDYETYMKDRLSGKTDAYGNPIGGWRKETVGGKEVWMGGNDNDNKVQKSNFQLEQENKAAEEAAAKAESEAKEQAAKEQADAYKKRRTALVGSRSLFARPGGRGFFN